MIFLICTQFDIYKNIKEIVNIYKNIKEIANIKPWYYRTTGEKL